MKDKVINLEQAAAALGQANPMNAKTRAQEFAQETVVIAKIILEELAHLNNRVLELGEQLNALAAQSQGRAHG